MYLKKTILMVSIAAALAACGGGGVELSSDQRIYESLALVGNGGISNLSVSLPATGAPTSYNYFYSGSYALASSPAGAANQFGAWTPFNLTNTLPLPTFAASPSRYLKDAVILVGPNNPQPLRVSYSGSGIQIDSLAQDQKTVASSTYYFGYSSQALTGTLASSPADLVVYLSSLFANPNLLKSGATWQTGATYIKHSARAVGDRITVSDCTAATTDANVSPCASNTSLTTYIQSLTGLSAGAFSTVQGLPFWTATVPSASGTPSYQVYFQLNGNVYRGSLVKDGTQSLYLASPGSSSTSYITTMPRFNAAAISSLKSAVNF